MLRLHRNLIVVLVVPGTVIREMGDKWLMKYVVVDVQPLVRQGLIAVLTGEEDLEPAGQAANVEEALAKIVSTGAGLVFLDSRLGDECGLDLVSKCRERRLVCKFIVLTSAASRDEFARANREGVCAYISKQALPEEIVAAVQVVSCGRKYYDPSITELMLSPKPNVADMLTMREREVLAALGEGLSNRDIAKRLYITEYTAKKHVSQILAKLELSGRTQAALYASSKGIS